MTRNLAEYSFGKKAMVIVGLSLVLMVGGDAVGKTDLAPLQILRNADRARGNLEGVRWKIELVSMEKDREKRMLFDVKAKGFDILCTCDFPPRDKGNKILMLNGNMWFYKPGLSRPVPISQRQKLIGNAAYGDIAATNYADDYDASYLSDEKIENELCMVFDLKAKEAGATYDRIKYWISKKRLVGVRAEYFTVSGKLIKTATMAYDNIVELDGEPHPFISGIGMEDVLIPGDRTTLTFSDPNIGEIPDYEFNINLLKK